VTPLWVARTLLGLVGGSSGDAGEAERSVGGEGRSYETENPARWNGSVSPGFVAGPSRLDFFPPRALVVKRGVFCPKGADL
jgi:hypothetical protein